MKKIQIFEPAFDSPEVIRQIADCLNSGWTGMGGKTIEFENKWKEYTKLPYAHFLNSNTAGLHLALEIFKKVFNWNDDAEVITTPITFISTNHMILHSKLVPVFCEVDEFLCLDPVDVEAKITNRTKAIMFVGIGGNFGQLKKIRELATKYNLKLILDAAHMSGSYESESKEHAGHGTDVAIFSFQAVKNLPTGDSGMICFKEKEHDSLARKLSWLGIDKDTFARSSEDGYKWKYDVPYLGYKYNGNAIMAAIALAQLPSLEKDNNHRNKLAEIYTNILSNNNKIKLILPSPDTFKMSRHLCQIVVPDRNYLMNTLATLNIHCGVHYNDNRTYTMYEQYGSIKNNIHEHIISLPLHLRICEEDVEFIAKMINIIIK